jgi:hypothetical protein
MERKCVCCPAVFVATGIHHSKITCSPECQDVNRKAKKEAWEKSPEGRAQNRASCAKYRKTTSGKKVRNKCNRDYMKTPKGMAAGKRRTQGYYSRKKAKGLCVAAGCWKKAAKGHVRCSDCHAAQNKRLQAYAKSKKAAA